MVAEDEFCQTLVRPFSMKYTKIATFVFLYITSSFCSAKCTHTFYINNTEKSIQPVLIRKLWHLWKNLFLFNQPGNCPPKIASKEEECTTKMTRLTQVHHHCLSWSARKMANNAGILGRLLPIWPQICDSNFFPCLLSLITWCANQHTASVQDGG